MVGDRSTIRSLGDMSYAALLIIYRLALVVES